MDRVADDARLSIESFFDACKALRRVPRSAYVPDFAMLNVILNRHNMGYEIRLPDLVPMEIGGSQIPVSSPPGSLSRSAQLLSEGRPREAVQESLW
jgi:hypothetical protein